ncbi:hypothetical protein [Sphingopyxis panaciterrulae]|uniref:Cupin domain protein n=2 Tax=Sphingopyxis TaxID=165697 RepID=A0A7W9B8D1_9SPHN|nr:hypothetical protein [Sphingopyxis panaciterrulae]MBB5708137.1 hypothetical protein [Sphingopyxis panaciterrulae]SBV32534.1 protein of unknown function [uncultured Sphingopyxis sp.]
MPYFFHDDPEFWHVAPPSLKHARGLAEIRDMKAAMFVLGEPDDLDAPLALFVRMPEGYVSQRHSHDCYRMELMIEGTHTRADGTVLKPGDISTNKPGEEYGPFVVGKGGSYSLELFSRGAAMVHTNAEKSEAAAAVAKLVEAVNDGTMTADEFRSSPELARWGKEELARDWKGELERIGAVLPAE